MTRKVYKVEIVQKAVQYATEFVVADSAEEAQTLANEMELDDGMFSEGEYDDPIVTSVDETDKKVSDYE